MPLSHRNPQRMPATAAHGRSSRGSRTRRQSEPSQDHTNDHVLSVMSPTIRQVFATQPSEVCDHIEHMRRSCANGLVFRSLALALEVAHNEGLTSLDNLERYQFMVYLHLTTRSKYNRRFPLLTYAASMGHVETIHVVLAMYIVMAVVATNNKNTTTSSIVRQQQQQQQQYTILDWLDQVGGLPQEIITPKQFRDGIVNAFPAAAANAEFINTTFSWDELIDIVAACAKYAPRKVGAILGAVLDQHVAEQDRTTANEHNDEADATGNEKECDGNQYSKKSRRKLRRWMNNKRDLPLLEEEGSSIMDEFQVSVSGGHDHETMDDEDVDEGRFSFEFSSDFDDQTIVSDCGWNVNVSDSDIGAETTKDTDADFAQSDAGDEFDATTEPSVDFPQVEPQERWVRIEHEADAICNSRAVTATSALDDDYEMAHQDLSFASVDEWSFATTTTLEKR